MEKPLEMKLYQNILDHINEGIYCVDQERKIILWNQAAEQITGYQADEVVGSHCQENILQHMDQQGKPICLVGCPLFATLQDNKVRVEQVFLRHKEGFRIPVMVRIFPQIVESETVGAIEIFTPVGNKIYDENLVEFLASSAKTDSLTQLPNRQYMEDYLNYMLQQYQRFGTNFCVLFLDIDDFRLVNNTYGHATGDLVLRNIGDEVTGQLRKEDVFGRWGGEEFLGVFEVKDKNDPWIIAEKIRNRLQECQTVGTGGDIIQITVSIGVTCVNSEDDLLSITERADALMYQSKQKGKNQTTMG